MQSLPSLSGTVTVVTGASGNIGAGIASQFAAAGSSVIVHYHRSPDAAEELASRLGGRAVCADLSSVEGCKSLMDSVGRLDTLVNCAGIQPVAALADITAGEWQSMLDTTLNSAFFCTQAAVAAMPSGGSIIHIASIEATQPAFGHAHYSAAKAALVMHARSAALEYGPLGIRVNSVSPGLIARPDIASSWPEGVARWEAAAPLTRLGTPADVGNACVFLASPMASWITGHNLVVDGGVSTHPTW
ncbi:SDR family oxidoreductase [Actinocrispum sp. NPDC049592]|uniref:SDR family NAD(P)-dependent oxidoreductase n=1 Tax=Actinocrispum sp. NPDC049592 TaxID=3154835 RepID=UPI0034494130